MNINLADAGTTAPVDQAVVPAGVTPVPTAPVTPVTPVPTAPAPTPAPGEAETPAPTPEAYAALQAEAARMEAKILQLNKENAERRVTAQSTETNLTKVLTALGITDAPSPEKAAQDIAAANQAALAAQRELTVYKAATSAGANVAALTDSRSFMAQIEALDPNDLDGITTAINTAVATNPVFQSAPARQAAPASTPTGTPRGDTHPSTPNGQIMSIHDAVTAQYTH